jgi:hypothetical protein
MLRVNIQQDRTVTCNTSVEIYQLFNLDLLAYFMQILC